MQALRPPFGRTVKLLGRTSSTLSSAFPHNGANRHLSRSSPRQSKLQVGDRIILRYKIGRDVKTKLTKPLREDGETIVDNIYVQHRDLIGKDSNFASVMTSKDGLRRVNIRARHPTLDEFTSIAPRRVAPIYANYASTIVSLLDIHPEPPSPDNDPDQAGGPSLQILEAGTGHGGLTIQLARAIAASNPPVTSESLPTPSRNCIYKHGEESDDHVVDHNAQPEGVRQWKSKRRAVINTVDIDHDNRIHSDQLLRSYRGGMYWPHIDFNSGNVKEWVAEKAATTSGQGFLDIVLLDMPGVENYISTVVPVMKSHSQLLIFTPQITQIAACVQQIVSKNLGLRLEKVVELGDAVSSGRLWDVRMATLKNAEALKKAQSHNASKPATNEELSSSSEQENVNIIPPMVCRPIVGSMTRGGGFVGLWKKTASIDQ